MIRARGLSKRFRGARVLAEVDLDVAAGQVLLLLGTNGSGRTTLLRILATLLRPSSGQVWVDGIDSTQEPARVRRRIGYSGPVAALNPRLTVGEHLGLAAAARGLDGDRLRRAVAGAQQLAGLTGGQPIELLSDGLRQRLALAAAMLPEPPVLLIDGDLSGLDPVARARFVDALRTRSRDGAAIVLACNSPDGLAEIGSQVALLHEGRLLESRPLDGGLEAPIRRLRRLAGGAAAAPDREIPGD